VPVLLIFRGLPGTGKSFLVRHLADRRPGFLVLSRDALRGALIPRPTFSEEEKGLVDELVASMAGWLLGRGKDVIIDGAALSSAAGVDRLVKAARSQGASAKIVECVCRQETALARLTEDGGSHPAGDRGESLYFQVKARFQALPRPSLTVDTDLGLEANLRAILAYIA
jgi:predicted kinase